MVLNKVLQAYSSLSLWIVDNTELSILTIRMCGLIDSDQFQDPCMCMLSTQLNTPIEALQHTSTFPDPVIVMYWIRQQVHTPRLKKFKSDKKRL